MNTAGNSGKRWSPGLAFFAITAVWTALCMIGCEKASDPDTPPATDPTPLTLAPPTTTLSATQTVAVLTARGGTPPYAWRTSDSSLGTVPDTDAATVTYTRTTALGAQVIRVEDRNRWTAESVIRQE